MLLWTETEDDREPLRTVENLWRTFNESNEPLRRICKDSEEPLWTVEDLLYQHLFSLSSM